jgi:hypothetical protein
MFNMFIKTGNKCSVLKLAGILLATQIFVTCNFLSIDQYIDSEMKLDSLFSNKRYIEAYMWNASSRLPDEAAIFGGSGMYTPGPMATDEGFTILGDFPGMNFVTGRYSSSGFGPFNRWLQYYQIIRQCNTIIARIDEASDWTVSERTRVLAYNRFIRAYAYYHLIMNWGPVVIMYDEIPSNNEVMEYYDRPRDLYDTVMNYICNEFEEAARTLPAKEQSIMDYGRPTKGAAYALIARLRLIHASPLFNGGDPARRYFGTWTRSVDGKHYISQTYYPERWAVAAAAAKRVIDFTVNGVKAYRLHTIENDDRTPPLPTPVDDPDFYKDFPEGAGKIDTYRSYAEMFNGETVMNTNPEFIWARSTGQVTAYTQHVFPYANGVHNGMCVTQKIVDAYEMADGRLRTNASEKYPYSESTFTTADTSFSDYRLLAGVNGMYVNREMRFYASIGFSECHWPCYSTSDVSYRNLTVTYYYDSPTGRGSATDPTHYPITGYVLKKYVNPNDSWLGTSARRIEKPFPIIRYAEILLAYAEALNALGGDSYTIEVDGVSQTYYRDVNEIKKAINQVRYRSGLPGLLDSDMGNQDYVLSKIKKERMVEFLFENQRYFDVRRWGDYEESETVPITGMNTSAGKDSYYQRVIPPSTLISSRVVSRKLLFLPVPMNELKRLPSFDQNPGW